MSEPATVGRYQLLSPLGRGAMGVVYRAHDPQLERDVAVKLIALAEGTGEEAFAETSGRFSREARVAARIHHPNVVTVYDAGESGDRLFLVMELVEGEALSSRLSRGEFPDRDQSLEIAAQAADALAAAHLAGIVHRDVKPGNILLSSRGQVKVSDFGVARAVGETTELTRTGMMVGSPAYMAPEQVSGRALDGRADLFSLGVVLYEMLLHRKPFPADTLTTLIYQILHQDPLEEEAVLGQLDPGVADLLQRTLAKDPEQRIPDAATFARRARELVGRGSEAPTLVPFAPRSAAGALLPPPSYATSAPTEQLERVADRRRFLPFVAAGVVLLLLAVVLWLRRPSPPPELGQSPAAGEQAASPAQPLSVAPAPEPPVAEAKAPEPADEEVVKPSPAAGKRAAAATTPPEPPPAATPEAVEPAVSEPAAPPPPPRISETFEGREGAEFNVDPEETEVEVDGRSIGIADDWDNAGGGKIYRFSGPGEHIVRLSLAGYRTVWVKVRIHPQARRKIADVDTELEELE
ncbi:MAG: protein kinase [Thermoanaerobaculia bacterium]